MAFSRILYPSEVLVAYNVSNHEQPDCIVVDASLHQAAMSMSFLYGGSGTVPIQTAPNGTHYVQLTLEAHRFVILT